MTSYIMALLMASLAAAIMEMLAPRGDGGRIAAHVRMIAGLFLLVALLSPLQKGIALLRSVAEGSLEEDYFSEHLPAYTPTDYEAAFGSTIQAFSASEAEAWVHSTLQAAFGIPPEGCLVEVICQTSDRTPILQEVRIALLGVYMLRDPHPIETYIADRLGCPCYVTVG